MSSEPSILAEPTPLFYPSKDPHLCKTGKTVPKQALLSEQSGRYTRPL